MDIKLDLLIPEDLPVEYELDEASKEKLSSSLNIVLRSLEDSSISAYSEVDRALNILDLVQTSPCVSHPKGEKKHQEAKDYDNYFNVSHIESNRPDISLVKSILVAYQRFLWLSDRNLLDAKNFTLQQQGFATYIRLVSRVFDLSLN